MQRIETSILRGQGVREDWGSEPNLRAEIKMQMALTIAGMMRSADVIDYVLTKEPNGDTKITASVMVGRTGDER